MRVNIVRPFYRMPAEINRYEVVCEEKYHITTIEVAATSYAEAKKIVEERYEPKQIYSVCLIEDDIWFYTEGYSSIIWWERKKRWF